MIDVPDGFPLNETGHAEGAICVGTPYTQNPFKRAREKAYLGESPNTRYAVVFQEAVVNSHARAVLNHAQPSVHKYAFVVKKSALKTSTRLC